MWTAIEPDFSNQGFGHPDAVIRLNFESGAARVIILEAKRLSYYKSCVPPSTRGGAGYNSSLNGQLELNHCLALALSEFDESKHELREPDWILHTPYSIERRGKLRRLQNPAVVDELVRPLSGISFRDIRHLIITSDVSEPFSDSANEPVWPELYHPEFPFQNCWKQLRGQFGWSSWAKVEGFFQKLVANANSPDSLFLTAIDRNRRNFKAGTGSQGMGDELDESSQEDLVETGAEAITVPAAQSRSLPANRGSRGGSMIYAPGINSSTFLHFSWLSESCAIRDYSRSPNIMPLEDRSMRTSEVLAGITREVAIRNRRPISDMRYWNETTLELNKIELSASR